MEAHETDHVHDMGDVSVLYVGGESTTPAGLEGGERIDVTAARAPGEARERLARNGVDCVVARQTLPDTDGVEFLARVRQQQPRLPLVLLADEPDEELVEAAVDAGMTPRFRNDRFASTQRTPAGRSSRIPRGRSDRTRLESLSPPITSHKYNL